jgi:hypothetical protein
MVMMGNQGFLAPLELQVLKEYQELLVHRVLLVLLDLRGRMEKMPQ